ncbi:ATP-binding cassette domain-containing protein [Actinomadura gamaensis]|uniref:ATP-binding cassette domain-containing protein n=1 Tax=Actinomadura gamaensis TaxID=1763541 RepID=A0ABV9U6L3_9ACTN
MSQVIKAEGLRKRFGETQALDGVDLTVEQGTVLGVLGPNGAGKTTAVRVLATLLKPDEGRAEICGYDVMRDATRVRALIGLTGQYASLDEELTGRENLVMIGRLLDLSRAEARARAAALLERFRLSDAAGRAVKTYSGGMRRRLDIAASMINRPRVVFLDEPTTGLDPRARGEVWETVREMTLDGATVLLTTQYLEEADALADRITVFDHGRVIEDGTPAELKARAGRQTLAVRAAEVFRTEQLAAIVAELTGERPEVRPDAGLVTAPVTDPGVLRAVVQRLDEAGLVAAEVALRLPSLDEVFLTLTGHAADESAVEATLEGSVR